MENRYNNGDFYNSINRGSGRMDVVILWTNFLNQIKTEITSLSFETWFKETELYELKDGKAKVIVPMPIHKKHLRDNYQDLIIETLNHVTGTNFEIEYFLKDEIEDKNSNSLEISDGVGKMVISSGVPYNNPIDSNLNKNYNFDNFIVGNSNKFAHAAALSVAEIRERCTIHSSFMETVG